MFPAHVKDGKARRYDTEQQRLNCSYFFIEFSKLRSKVLKSGGNGACNPSVSATSWFLGLSLGEFISLC